MASDPFADISLANMHIGDKPSGQTQMQPSYDVWGITPTTAVPPVAAAPATSLVPAPAPPPMQAPQQSVQPTVQPMNPYTPAPQQPYQQPPAPTQYQTYPQVTPQAQPPAQYAQPPAQYAQPPAQYAPPPANAAFSAPMQAPAPVAAQAPPQAFQAPYQAQAPVSPPPPQQGVSYDPFGASAGAPVPGANPFAPPLVPLAPTSTDKDDSPTPQRPADVPQCVTLEIKDAAEDESTKGAVDVEDDEADFWAQMGFAVEEAAAPAAEASSSRPGMGKKRMSVRASIVRSVPKAVEGAPAGSEASDDQGMPTGGKYYTATLPSGQFGAILYSTKQVSKNIYYTAPPSFIENIGNRSVVAYTSSDSGVDRAGISVGDILLKVEGEEVTGPKNAMGQIRKECNSRHGFSGINLALWKPPPSISVTLAENQCMVEYHIKTTTAPATSFDWKSKYVVVGGIVSEPNVINMYYGKRDYDKAVSEITASQPRVSVKIKSWSLAGGRLLTPKPKTVHYSTKKTPWYYFVVLTQKGKAIKVAHPMLDGLKPVFEGVKRAIKHDPYTM